MNSLEEIALKVAKDAFAEIYGPSTTDPDPAMVKWISENARRLVAALGAQEPVGEILHNPGGCYEGSPIPAAPYDYAEFSLAMPPPGTKLFAAPVLPSVKEGWQPIETAPKDGRRFLCATVIPNHRQVIAMRGVGGVLLDEQCQPLPWPMTHWMPLPAAPSPQEEKK